MHALSRLLLGALLTCGACISVKPISIAPDFKQNALQKQRVVAVLPFYIEYPEGEPEEGVSIEQHVRQRRLDRIDDSYAMQGDLAIQLMRKQRRLSFRVQDTAETNRLLRQSGLSWDSLFTQPRANLAKIVHADATLTPYAGLAKSGPAAGFIWALGLTTGAWIQNQHVATGIVFHDGATGGESCHCQCKLPGTVLDDPGALADKCMKYIIHGLPYRAKTLRRLTSAKAAGAPATGTSATSR